MCIEPTLPPPPGLVVLLAMVGLGRPVFGVLLVIAYGAGMAGTLTAAGLALPALGRRLAGRSSGLPQRLTARLGQLLPALTAALIVVVGLTLAVRAAASLG
jgi:nickel/cobalt transporter (NicO) family protein